MTQSQIKIINQAVDTYKEHYYPSQQLEQSEIIDYNDFVLDLISLKKEAQEITSHNGDERYVTEEIQGNKFHILATTQKGFAVTIKNKDVSISFKRFKKVSKQPCIKIEYRAEYLARYSYRKCVLTIKDFLKEILPHSYAVASEMHLCTDIQGYDFTVLDFFRLKSRSRKSEIFTDEESSSFFDSKKFTGLYIGSGNFMIRIYDKTHEIKKYPEKAFVKPSRWFASQNFEEDKTVWRIEVQIRREKLKTLFNGDTFMDDSFSCLNNLTSVWKLFMDKFKLKDLSEESAIQIMLGKKKYKNGLVKPLSKYAIRKRFNEAQDAPVWQSISQFWETPGRNLTYQEEIKKPSKLYVENSLKSVFSTLTKHMGGNFDTLALADIAMEMNSKEIEKTGMSIFDQARIKAIESFSKQTVYYEQNRENGICLADDFKLYEQNLENNIIKLFSNMYSQANLTEDFKETVSDITLEEIAYKLGFEPTKQRKLAQLEREMF